MTAATLDRERLGAAGIIVRLMHECEALRAENQRLRIAVRGFDIQPESPFPLLSGAEVVNILHPEAHQPTANNLDDTTDADELLDALHRALGGFEERQCPASDLPASPSGRSAVATCR